MAATTHNPVSIPLPAVRGIQAGREYYVVMCPLRAVATLFHSKSCELPPELRAQRILTRGRIPQLVRYIAENPASYVFSSLAASVDAEMRFVPVGPSGAEHSIGTLHIPVGSRMAVNDGQHRLAAIEEAIKKSPALADENISIVLYADAGLAKSQQMFADLNRYAVRPTRSLNILYDHRDSLARLARQLADSVPVFKGMTVMESNSISNRARKLFTLNSIYHATGKLLGKHGRDTVSADEERLAHDFWSEVGQHMPEWTKAARGEASPYDLRQSRVHSHGIALHAIAAVGSSILSQEPKTWRRRLEKLEAIDWARSNLQWEGRALSGGTMCKAGKHLLLTSNLLKKALGLPLDAAERKVEEAHESGRNKQPDRTKPRDAHKEETRRSARKHREPLRQRRKAVGHRL